MLSLCCVCTGGHPYVWMPHEYVWTLPYVWMPPVCTQHKESMLVTLRGVHMPHMCGHPLYVWMAPGMFECPHMCGHPLFVWMLSVCLDAPHVWTPPICLDAPISLNILLYV